MTDSSEISKKADANLILDEETSAISDFYQNIIACMPGNVYWMDTNSIFLGCNDNVATMLGLKSRFDIVGLSHHDTAILRNWQDGQAESFRQDDLEVINSGLPKFHVEEPPITDADGNEIYYLTSRVPIFDKNKKVIGVVGISIDITERKRAEAREKAALIQASQSEALLIIEKERTRAATRMAATVAHEMRTPLLSIQLGATGLKKHLPALIKTYSVAKDLALEIPMLSKLNQSALADSLDAIIGEVNGANSFIDMLLFNVSEEPFAQKSQLCSILECINEAFERYPFGNTNQRDAIINEADDFEFLGNRELMIHIIFNLLKNSLYFINTDLSEKIFIKSKNSYKWNELCFMDTGKGISVDVLPYIFDNFYSKTVNGTGIGLSFCKKVMESPRRSLILSHFY